MGELTRIAAAVLAGLILLTLVGAPKAAVAAPPARSLRVLFTHDLHSHLTPFRVATDDGGEKEYGGFARIAQAIKEERAVGGDSTLVLDAGDFSMGTLFHTAFASDALELRAMGQMGYDVTTFGNHELDFHSEGLAQMLGRAKASGDPLPQIVASNFTLSDGDLARAFRDYPVRDYAVIEKNGLRIGLFGLLGKDAAEDVGFADDVKFADQVESAKRVVEALKNQEKVDVVIALSHCGTSPDASRSEDEALARTVPQIDLIVSGHTHTVLRQPIVVGKTVIVSSGSFGQYLGVVGLDFAKGDGPTVTSYQLREIDPSIPPDEKVASTVAADEKLVESRFLASYGFRFDQPLAEADYNLESLQRLDARPGETGLGDLIADSFREAVKRAEGSRYEYVTAAIHPVGAIRDSLVRGPITTDDVFRVLSLGLGADGTVGYPLATFWVTGDELRRALEVETTLAPLKTDYRLQVSGIRFAYNPNRVPLDRVTSVRVSEPSGEYRPAETSRLYRVCVDYQVAAMLGSITRKSYGILQLTPKDRDGRPITDMRTALVDADPKTPGTQELKEWTALASYLEAMPDTDGDGVPNLSERYRQTEGRIAAAPSWSPADLLGGVTYVTFGFLGAGAVALILVCLLVWALIRLVRWTVRSARRRRVAIN